MSRRVADPAEQQALLALLRPYGLANGFERQLRGYFFERIGGPRFHACIVSYLRAADPPHCWNTIGGRLGVNSGTISRWNAWQQDPASGSRPDFDHLLTYLALIQEDPAEVLPPDPWKSFSEGVRDALRSVAGWLGKDAGNSAKSAAQRAQKADRELTDRTWPALVAALLLLDVSELRSSADLRAALQAVRDDLAKRWPAAVPTVEQLGAWISAWVVPWFALCAAVPAIRECTVPGLSD